VGNEDTLTHSGGRGWAVRTPCSRLESGWDGDGRFSVRWFRGKGWVRTPHAHLEGRLSSDGK